MRNSRGVSIVELLLALSACGVILTLSAGLIERIMKAELRSREYARVERTALRLANAFRRDVWQATQATPASDQEGTPLRLTLSETESVEYRQQPGAVLRILLKQGEVIGRETFVFPATAAIEIQAKSAELLALSVEARPEGPAADKRPRDAYAPPIALAACARLARDRAVQWTASPPGDRP